MNGWRTDGYVTRVAGGRADGQVSDFFVARFLHPDLPLALVTCKSFARTGNPAARGVFYVTTEIEYLICSDPRRRATTATWHDITTEDEDGTWPNQTAAAVAAFDTARRWRTAADTIDWDGTPQVTR